MDNTARSTSIALGQNLVILMMGRYINSDKQQIPT